MVWYLWVHYICCGQHGHTLIIQLVVKEREFINELFLPTVCGVQM